MTDATTAIDPRYVSLLWATPEHADEIARVHAMLFPTPWESASIQQMLNDPGSVALVAAGGNPRVIGGFVLAQVAADEAEILTIGVAGPWQRHGIATRLVEGAKRAAKKAGAERIFLEVGRRNASAIALYKKAGFAEVGERKGYYTLPDGSKEDAIILRAELG
ncbi:MAG: ribosomal protein S18-alanine N-acetyltransferase [Hyphomicrobiaceae bacterium]